jgi:nucleoside-diphosphate-sugar epimerase
MKVTVLLRTGHGAGAFEKAGIKARICPLQAGPELTQAIDGQEILFHLAYDFRASGAENLAAFKALIKTTEAAGCERIVHLSSAVVYDQWPNNGAISEQSPITPEASHTYRAAKIAMEQRLMQGHCSAVILQPTIVYGPGSAMWTQAPLAMMRRGGVILPDPTGQCAAVYVDDVVQAILRAGTGVRPGCARYLISGPDAPGWDTFFEGYARLAGYGQVQRLPADTLAALLPPPGSGGPVSAKPPLAARISARVRQSLGRRRVEALVARLQRLRAHLSRPRLAHPDASTLKLYSGTPLISTRQAQDQLGYIPRISFADGLRRIEGTTHEQSGL